jgi:anaerobic selenocysteine-containing dehydrogenase
MNRSRREALRLGAAAVAGACLASGAATQAAAQAKASKQSMQYQDQPKNGQECDQCMHWIPGPKPDAQGQCKVVEGPINPKGWCAAFVKKQ